jgi:ketosteroid isomerase-like protein
MPVKMSKIETAIRLVLAMTDAFNTHDVAAMTPLLDDDCTLETADPAPDGRMLAGRDAIAAYYTALFLAMPTLRLEPEDIAGLGHRCVRQGRLVWQEADGRTGSVRAVDIFDERNGRIAAQISYVKGQAIGPAPGP